MSEQRIYNRDHVYLGPKAKDPKHMFVVLGDRLQDHTGGAGFSLCDIGCASGAFIEYGLSRFPNITATGVDFSLSLVESATARIPNAVFMHGDANRLDGLMAETFDIVTMTGTHSIFDDFRPSFSECLRIAAPGALVLITGLFNPFPVDALVQWRYADGVERAWNPGYNLFSERAVSRFLQSSERVARFSFTPFSLPFDLPPQDDPIRSWTETEPAGSRVLRNGIMSLPMQTLAIAVK
ncbi:hypothetical protein ASE66_13600 [Bosea sp. Root483D1]|uniref:class I SAM-dependent methyltransferase n=1 Tax=Bosea sp. Root483D1 TaxID=1736544 RepID=UPI000708FA67|nr:class I SAM-dependent methyltransferase [Bosea sp. Root483D1]KRE14410.1 hypothetical protein ASE66_13600 [Bosea sp. Root483D1]